MAAPADEPAAPGPSTLPTGPSPRALIAVVSAGIFVTGFGWPGILGYLPINLMLKNQLHLSASDVAWFWSFATFAWYFKPFIGFACDAYPLGGTRHRGYLLTGSVLAGLFWLLLAVVPRRYLPLMAVMTALNLSMAVVSTVVGGLQVEVSQREGATGRLASLRTGLEGVMSLLGGPVGGWLAVVAFTWTAVSGAAVLLSFVPVVAWLYREPRGAIVNRQVWTSVRTHLRTILRSRAMWGATGLLFLIYLAPGFGMPMLYYQQDVLKFDPTLMGYLQLLNGAGGILGAAAYGYICRRLPLKTTLIAGIAIGAAVTLLYLRYDSAEHAVLIDTAYGFVSSLAALPIYDLAARATPRGVEGFGFGLMMSIRNVAVFVISAPFGAYLYDHYHMSLRQLVWLNAGSSAAVLLFVPLLPAALLAAREESSKQPQTT
jgi:predicted MFS family arabinose efflux permease